MVQCCQTLILVFKNALTFNLIDNPTAYVFLKPTKKKPILQKKLSPDPNSTGSLNSPVSSIPENNQGLLIETLTYVNVLYCISNGITITRPSLHILDNHKTAKT